MIEPAGSRSARPELWSLERTLRYRSSIVPPNTSIFLLGLAVGTGLLVIGVLLGFFLGRRAGVASQVVDRHQFLGFLQNLSHWTSEFAGDVSKYQTQLTSISHECRAVATHRARRYSVFSRKSCKPTNNSSIGLIRPRSDLNRRLTRLPTT